MVGGDVTGCRILVREPWINGFAVFRTDANADSYSEIVTK